MNGSPHRLSEKVEKGMYKTDQTGISEQFLLSAMTRGILGGLGVATIGVVLIYLGEKGDTILEWEGGKLITSSVGVAVSFFGSWIVVKTIKCTFEVYLARNPCVPQRQNLWKGHGAVPSNASDDSREVEVSPNEEMAQSDGLTGDPQKEQASPDRLSSPYPNVNRQVTTNKKTTRCA